jgi:hypothetical protein
METLLAAIRIHRSAADCADRVHLLERALQVVIDPGRPMDQAHWSSQDLAAAWTMPLKASDSVCATSSNQLVYINGPVAALETPAQQQLISFEGRYGERVAALGQAAQSWLLGKPDLNTLSGSFCALYHDADAAHTLVISDRLASRPVFYCTAAGWLYIASDIRPLLRLPDFKPELDLESIAQFIRYQTILDDRTLYRNIKVLAPGTVLSIEHGSGEYRQDRYWSLAPLPLFTSRTEAIEATATAFSAATNRIVADSQQLGILLSGGFDSRMLMTSLDQAGSPWRAYTFGPAFTQETQVARQVAQACAIPWQFIEQPLAAYWSGLCQGVHTSNGLHAGAHMHLAYPSARIVADGCDTVLNGWGFDLPYSGSYLPKETFQVLGRQLYTYRLLPLQSRQAVVDHLHATLDMQSDQFAYSLFGSGMRQHWEAAPVETLARLVSQASAASESPYDWIDYTLMGFGVSKFRSYSMLTNVRAQARERNPLFESDVLDVYLRLPYQWRFLGPIFRRAVRHLNPDIAHIAYSNTGISAFAPPIVQAVAMQGRATLRANVARVRALSQRLVGQTAMRDTEPFGSYHESFDMARYLETGAPDAQAVGQMLRSGLLVEAGMLDPSRLEAALQRCHGRLDRSGFTLMAWVALALWLDSYPADLPRAT